MASTTNGPLKKGVSISEMFSKDEATLTTDEYSLPGDDDESENDVEESDLVDKSDALVPRRSGVFKRIDCTGSVFTNSSGVPPINRIILKISDNELNLIDRNSIKQKQSIRVLADLTIDKLNTSSIGFIGRANQIECYNLAILE